MSIQYQDNTFSELLPFREATRKFFGELKAGLPVKALHLVGGQRELDEMIDKAKIEGRVDQIEKRLDAMKAVESDVLHIPNKDELKAFSGKEKP